MKKSVLYFLIIFLLILVVLIIYFLTRKEKFLNIEKKYIISLSTIPNNFDNIYKTISSLISQSEFSKIDKIIVNVPRKYSFRFNNESIKSDKITKFKNYYKNKNVYINLVNNDFGPGTKLLGLFENNIVNFNDSNKYLIIVDDDVTYVPDMIEKFEKYNQNNNIKVASGWTYMINDIIIGQAVDAFFIKLDLLKDFWKYFQDIKHLDYVKYHDDIYITYYLWLRNNKVHGLEKIFPNGSNKKIDITHNETQLHNISGKYSRKNVHGSVMIILNNYFKK